MRIRRPGGTPSVRYVEPVDVRVPETHAPAPPPSRPRRTPEGVRWLDDERYRGRTDKLVLDTKLAMLNIQPGRQA